MINGLTMDELYRDQAPIHGWPVSSVYLTTGLKRMDSDYRKRICEGKEDKEKLKKEIRKNPHLHKVIKDNLIYNLNNR